MGQSGEGLNTSNEMQLDNPPNLRTVVWFLAISIFFYILGIAGYYNGPNDIIILLIMWSIASLAVLLTFFREFLHRPKRLKIHQDGVELHFRTGKSVYYPFSTIAWIETREDILGKYGLMEIVGQFVLYQLTYEIVQSIKRNYFGKMRYFPTTKDQYRKRMI